MHEIATFAAGCFWGVEEEFLKTEGVVSTRVGYTGGRTENPTYNDVCWNETGHAEAVEVTFDPQRIAYADLVALFFTLHNPTSLNFQGPDVGTQYRSAIFYHSPEQKMIAEQIRYSIVQSQKYGEKPIVTEIVPLSVFYPAEEYHQQYLRKNNRLSCHLS